MKNKDVKNFFISFAIIPMIYRMTWITKMVSQSKVKLGYSINSFQLYPEWWGFRLAIFIEFKLGPIYFLKICTCVVNKLETNQQFVWFIGNIVAGLVVQFHIFAWNMQIAWFKC